MISPIQGRQYPGGSIDFFEISKIVLSSQIHATAPVQPVIRLRASQENHGFYQRRPYLKHRAVLFCKISEDRRNVAITNMWIEQ